MRVLVTADPMLPVPPPLYGGIERIIATLVERLIANKQEVGLVARRDSTCAATANFDWPSDGIGRKAHLRTLWRAVHTFKPDVIHSFSRLAYLLPVLLNRRLPKLMSYQRRPTVRTVRWANRAAFGSLSFTGCSEHISRAGRAAGGKWKTIHNFVNVESYTFQPSVDGDAPLVFLSRIESIKGPHLAIEAARRVGRKLILAGNHSDTNDDEGRYWREQIQPHIDGDDVQYVGAVDDIEKNRLLGAAAGLIVPIQWEEPFGIVFVEALACGTPVISCARGALPEIVRNGIDGYLVDTTDETVEAIRRLPEISRQNCRSRAEEYFSSSAIVPQYTALYASIRRA